MATHLTERLRTDSKTQAVLQFFVGGRAGIGRNTQIEIVSPKDVEKYGAGMRVNTGLFWGNMDSLKTNYQIQTSGGVIGIEGTELLVGVDPEKGVTEVLLFEGKVTVTDDKGNEKEMFPGDYAEFGGPKSMCVLSYPPASLRTLVVERFPSFSSFIATQKVTSIPNPASPTLVRGFNKIRPDLLAVWSSAQESTGQAVSGLTPSEGSTGPGVPTFSWRAVPDAASYALYITGDEVGQEVLFSVRTEDTSFTVPEGAPSLEGGRYFWSVVPLGEDGAPLGKVATTWFETPGWTATGVTLEELPGVPEE